MPSGHVNQMIYVKPCNEWMHDWNCRVLLCWYAMKFVSLTYLVQDLSISGALKRRYHSQRWYDWPSVLTSYTGIIIWYQRQGFGLVPIVSNRSDPNSSDQEINIWAARVEIWCATGVCSGPHSIHHLHHTTGPTHQEEWSDFPSICRRYPALFSI